MNLLESLLSWIGTGQILAICLMILGWQQQLRCTVENMISGVENTLMILQQFQEFIYGIRPLVCSLPVEIDKYSVHLGEIPIFQIFEQKWVFYQFIHDEGVETSSCHDYQQQLYWNKNAFELQKCSERNKSPFVYRVVKIELAWIKKNHHYQISLRQSQAKPQVIVSGFSDFAIQWDGRQKVSLSLKWPHFPRLHWSQNLC